MLISYANMQISMTGIFSVNALGHRNTLAKFQAKILQEKSSMKVYS